MKVKTLSVVIPTHDRHDVLERVLAHLAEGSAKPDEVIVVDDGSTPPVEEAIRTGAFGLPEVRILRHEKSRGAAAARNAGAAVATGDVVVFLDDDVLPDYHCIRYHRQIHERRPAANYGVMGRVYFDPDLPRTPPMHFLEETGGFSANSKGEDRAPQTRGLISANFSLKRAFIQRQERLFDEQFPYSQSEDTEFGVRMTAEGWDLRHHIAPSARHHSPFSLEDFCRKVWESGVSKAYWSLKRPNDTVFCQWLEQCFVRKEQENWFRSMSEEYRRTLGERFLRSDIGDCSPWEYEGFAVWMRNAIEWHRDLGIFDGWQRFAPRFESMIADLRKAFAASTLQRRCERLQAANKLDPEFLPVALELAGSLRQSGELQAACDALAPVGRLLLAKIPLFSLQYEIGHYEKCAALAQEAYEETASGTHTAWRLRREICKQLLLLLAENQLDLKWARDAWVRLSPLELVHNTGWVERLREALLARGKLPKNSLLQDALGRIENLRAIERRFGAVATRTGGFLDKSGKKSQEEPRYLAPARISHGQEAKPGCKGVITWYAPQKRFGFLKSDKGGRLLFVHGSSVKAPGFRGFEAGDRVAFDACETALGLEARNICYASNLQSTGAAPSIGDGRFDANIREAAGKMKLGRGGRVLMFRCAPEAQARAVIEGLLEACPKIQMDLLVQEAFVSLAQDARVTPLVIPEGPMAPRFLPARTLAEIRSRDYAACVIPYNEPSGANYGNVHDTARALKLPRCPIYGIDCFGRLHAVSAPPHSESNQRLPRAPRRPR